MSPYRRVSLCGERVALFHLDSQKLEEKVRAAPSPSAKKSFAQSRARGDRYPPGHRPRERVSREASGALSFVRAAEAAFSRAASRIADRCPSFPPVASARKTSRKRAKKVKAPAMDGPDFDPADLSSKREWVKIGSGSFGNVYKATLLGTTVAVKEIGKCVPPADARPFVILPPSISKRAFVGNLGCEKASPEKHFNAPRRRTKRARETSPRRPTGRASPV